jgi:acetyl esterase/lipase
MTAFRSLLVVILLVGSVGTASAQKLIQLYSGKAPGSETWNWTEKEYFNEMTKQRMVYNVVQPTLEVYEPAKGKANGTAVVIAPGGGFHILSIDSEGINVAKWLNEKGITAFVLRYRLVQSMTNDPFMEMMQAIQKGISDSNTTRVVQLGINDGLEAMKYVRKNAVQYGIDPKKIGIMGFSAGGTVTTGVLLNYTAESRPDFAAPIYPYTGAFPTITVPKDAPPLFVLAASDDQLMLAPHSVGLYNLWLGAGKSAELHLYAKGGHGFGMRKQNLPTDNWIERYGEWLVLQGFAK